MILENINSELKVAQSKVFQNRALVGHMCHKKFHEIFLFVCASLKYSAFIHLRRIFNRIVRSNRLHRFDTGTACSPVAHERFKRQLVNHAHVFWWKKGPWGVFPSLLTGIPSHSGYCSGEHFVWRHSPDRNFWNRQSFNLCHVTHETLFKALCW
jgi:hypothetical protein